tara:strand:+ start:128 stop:286 length:159 start_codon:yes stop_codon:yes gene_type:complete
MDAMDWLSASQILCNPRRRIATGHCAREEKPLTAALKNAPADGAAYPGVSAP